MKILGIEHIGIAVESLDNAAPFWRDILGIPHAGRESVTSQSVTTDIFDTEKGKVELLEPLTDTSPISKFLLKRGNAMHHVCLEVSDIDSALVELKQKNINVLHDQPTLGAEGYRIIFVHPKDTGGVLVELAEKPKVEQ